MYVQARTCVRACSSAMLELLQGVLQVGLCCILQRWPAALMLAELAAMQPHSWHAHMQLCVHVSSTVKSCAHSMLL